MLSPIEAQQLIYGAEQLRLISNDDVGGPHLINLSQPHTAKYADLNHHLPGPQAIFSGLHRQQGLAELVGAC